MDNLKDKMTTDNSRHTIGERQLLRYRCYVFLWNRSSFIFLPDFSFLGDDIRQGGCEQRSSQCFQGHAGEEERANDSEVSAQIPYKRGRGRWIVSRLSTLLPYSTILGKENKQRNTHPTLKGPASVHVPCTTKLISKI